MSKTISLQVSPRASLGRNAVKGVRKGGKVPGIMYGKTKGGGIHSKPIQVDARLLKSVLHSSTGENVLVEVEVRDDKGEKLDQHLALLTDVQHHPIEDYIIHVDLHELAQDELMHAEVPVQCIGEPVGIKVGGGLLETMMRTIRVTCLPKDLPGLITVDVTSLNVGESVHVRELKLPDGVTAANPPELPVFTCFAPKVETAESIAAAAEVKQPEVIKEKKVDENAAPAAGGKDAKGGKAAPAKK